MIIKEFFQTFATLKEKSMQERAERSRELKKLRDNYKEEDDIVTEINSIAEDLTKKSEDG
jgi:hypothetical protein